MQSTKQFRPLELILPKKENEHQHCMEQVILQLQGKRFLTKVHMDKIDGKKGICVHYDSQKLTLTQVNKLIEITGAKISKQYQHKTVSVNGMNSAESAKTIEFSLHNIPGIITANVGYASESLRIEYDTKQISFKKILQQVIKLGFSIREENKEESWLQRYNQLILSLLSGVLLLISWPLGAYFQTFSLILALIAFISGGFYAFIESLNTLMQKRFDIEVLMIVAAIGAGILGSWDEGALLLFLFSLGHALEHFAMDKARRSVKALGALTPKTALVKKEKVTEEVRISELLRDEIVIVSAGKRIPIDGIVTSGTSAVDQSSITGESIPVDKQSGDNVYAGTVNCEGTLQIKVTKLAKDSTLNRMVQMVTEADTQKSNTQRFTETFQQYYVPIVIVGVILLIFTLPFIGFTWSSAIYRALTVLVAASPCALAIATPAAVLSGVGRAAQLGVLIKGGMHLENLGLVKSIAFDKTGTITEGKPKVTNIIAFECSKNDVLLSAAVVEQQSSHPIAKAIVTAAKEQSLNIQNADETTTVIGKGIYGKLNGDFIEVGNTKLFENITPEVNSAVLELQNNGCTTMVICKNKKIIGVIGVSDVPRPDVKATLRKLADIGIEKTIMLTGDNKPAAQAIAKLVGITEVYAELLPEDKLSAIRKLEKENKYIAMVGDGVNDAPAMVSATVGIAMGGAGTDVALEAADIALMSDDLSKLPSAISLSRAAKNIISQNLWMSLGVVFFLVLMTLSGIVSIGLTVTIHEGSSLVVVFNALRLLRFR
jgi:Zn2+/Cd2+-exporting ATPase